MNNPEGRGMFIWKLGKLFGGDYKKALEWAQYMKLDWVAVKFLNGKWKYNYWNGCWQIKKFIEIFHTAGIDVHGWQWVLMEDPVNEGKALVKGAKELGLKGVLMNIEAPCKNANTQSVSLYCQEAADLEIPVGFSSYRYPSYHREIAYPFYLDVCTYISPQIYFQPAHNPVEQLLRSKKEYGDLGYDHLPFVPTGPAYQEHGWKPLKQELIDLNQGVIEEKYPGISWWRFGTSVALDFASVIAKMPSNYGGAILPVPPPPPPDAHFKTIANLNIRENPSAKSLDIGTLKVGSDITIVERNEVWGRIQGWIHTDFLEPL